MNNNKLTVATIKIVLSKKPDTFSNTAEIINKIQAAIPNCIDAGYALDPSNPTKARLYPKETEANPTLVEDYIELLLERDTSEAPQDQEDLEQLFDML